MATQHYSLAGSSGLSLQSHSSRKRVQLSSILAWATHPPISLSTAKFPSPSPSTCSSSYSSRVRASPSLRIARNRRHRCTDSWIGTSIVRTPYSSTFAEVVRSRTVTSNSNVHPSTSPATASLSEASSSFSQASDGSTNNGRSQFAADVSTATSSAETRRATSASASAVSQSSALSQRRRTNPNMIEFSANLQTNIPLRQHPEATFDDYLQQSERVFGAFFPDKHRCDKIGKHTWRVHMLPLEFFLLSVKPVIDMDLLVDPRPSRTTYPGAKSVIHLISRHWELRGVEYKRSEFDLSLSGALYAVHLPSRVPPSSGASPSHSSLPSTLTNSSSVTTSPRQASGGGVSQQAALQRISSSALTPSSLRGSMSIRVALVAPGVLAALPTDTISSVGSAVLSRLLGAMKDKVNTRVLEDYKVFVRERTGVRL